MAISIPRQSEATSLSLSVLAHLGVVAVLTLNLSLWEQPPERPVRLAIDAALVMDNSALQERQRQAERDRQRQAELDRQREAERAAAERQRQADERQRQAEQERQSQAAEQQRAAAAKLEQQRRADAAKLEQAEAKARAERERLAAEQARQRKAEEAAAEAERRRQAAEQQRQQESEAQLLAQLAAEEERDSAVSAGQLDLWREMIRQDIERNWVKPGSAGAGINCEVLVTQIPGGDVIDVTVGRCNGDAVVVRSIENAVKAASPLPSPPDPSLFERRLILDFIPEN